MIKISDNDFIAGGNVTVNVNDNSTSYKEFKYCTSEELVDFLPKKKLLKKLRGKQLHKESVKWLVLLLVGLFIMWSFWANMGYHLNFKYLSEVNFNFLNIEHGVVASLFNVLIPVGFLCLFIFLPFYMSLSKIVGNDKIYLHHMNDISKINEILQLRGVTR